MIIEKKTLLQALIDIGAFKQGEFILKSGQFSPIYIDLRSVISYPLLLRQLAQQIWQSVKHLCLDVICGVPYTALPIASCLSIEQNLPMVLCRKEVKQYGTKKQIEGHFEIGQRCLIIEDVVTTASSVLQTIELLEQQGLQIRDVVALVDREAGGCENLQNKGYRLHSIFTLTELLPFISNAEEVKIIESK